MNRYNQPAQVKARIDRLEKLFRALGNPSASVCVIVTNSRREKTDVRFSGRAAQEMRPAIRDAIDLELSRLTPRCDA